MKTFSRKIAATLLLAAACVPTISAQITFNGVNETPVTISPEKNTGLDAIYVLYSAAGATATFSGEGAANAHWFKYSNMGAGYAEEISDISRTGTTSTLEKLEPEMGYYVEYNGSSRYYFWVTDYSAHRLSLKGVEPAAEQDCEKTVLNLSFSGSPLRYYTINGQQRTIDQEIKITYYNLDWNERRKEFTQGMVTYNLESPAEVVSVFPPVLCSTTFEVSGDKFLKAWGMEETAESSVFRPVAISSYAFAEDLDTPSKDEDRSNRIDKGNPSDALGGSAPANISFTSFNSDAVIHMEWQFADDEDFENILYRFNSADLDYTFVEEGTTYVRFIAANASNTCDKVSDTFTVFIGSSELQCPNIFTPFASPGVNDKWKVAYRSLVEFKCNIFDRYGQPIFTFTDPDDGWDGTYRGKPVNPGVYFYVIEARGADGKAYNKSGDINIIGFKGVENKN